MLSYMWPMDEKPPPGPHKGAHHMQLPLQHQHQQHLQQQQQQNHHQSVAVNGNSPISKETSVSSFVSDGTTATATSHSSMTTPTSTSERGKTPKLAINGGKHQTLKRVSFGSSKGSMVETLIFESPVQEEPEPSPIPENVNPFPEDQDQTETEREKVRVTFFQQSKPQEVDLPDEPLVFGNLSGDVIDDFVMSSAAVVMNESGHHVVYNRTESTESGWDNPFRPGGDLSREADEIVELIKGGKPITPTPSSLPDDPNHHANGGAIPSPQKAGQLGSAAPGPGNSNGNAVKSDGVVAGQKRSGAAALPSKTTPTPPGAVDVKRATVRPDGDAMQVEHVTIKKKPKCKCCVIQ